MNHSKNPIDLVMDEKNGFVNLPKAGINSEMRKKLGIEVVSESDSWYYTVKVPKGWKVVVCNDGYEDEIFIVDEQERRRIEVVIDLKQDGNVLAAYTRVLRRFYAIVETSEIGRKVYLRDRLSQDFSMPICMCGRTNSSVEEKEESCGYMAMAELSETYPSCNDITAWDDDHQLVELEKFQEEYECKKRNGS